MKGRKADISRLLGLTGPGAWVLAGLYCVTYATLAGISGGEPMQTPQGKVALALVLASAVLLVLPWPHPLPLPLVLGVLGVVAFSTVAISWELSPYGWPGWVSWNFGADTFLMFMVALRGRVWWGAVGMLLMAAITIHWTYSTTGDWWHGFDLTYRQIASYAAGAFFAVWLGRTASRIADFQEAERRRVEAEHSRAAAAEERREQLDRVRALAGPALARIADGSTTAAERREHRLLEAELRDQIRGRGLAVGGLPAALREARVRGAEIALLDDVRDDTLPADLVAAATAWAVERVDAVQAGDATIRLARIEGDPVVTFATSSGFTESFSPRQAVPSREARGLRG